MFASALIAVSAGLLPAPAQPDLLEIVDGRLRLTPAPEAAPEPERASAQRLRIVDGALVLVDVETDDAPAMEPVPADPRRQGLELVGAAVAQGAPLYNAGLPEACVAVYDVAVRGLLLLDDESVPADLRRQLQDSLADAARARGAADAAWILRGGLDRAAESFTQVADVTASAEPRPRFEERVLLDLDGGSRWASVNDDVMGGVSRGSLRGTDRGTAVYTGQLSLANNGGFSTVRSPARDLDLAGWDGLVLRVRGDGRTYSIQALRSDRRGAGHSWNFEFATEADTWTEVRVPFDAMVHKIMGFSMGDAVDPAEIRSLAFMIADKDTRPFALEVDWIKVWRER